VTFPTSIHDLLDPLSGQRVSLRIERGALVERAASLPSGTGRAIDGSNFWILPALYDADAHMPLVDIGLRASDAGVALHGGVARVNVALQWQDIVGFDLEALVADLTRWALPAVTPILSVHSDRDSAGFSAWLHEHADAVRALLPPVCKLYSYGDGFWANLDTVFEHGLLPIIYCKELADVEAVVAKAPGPVHFRHAMTTELVHTMRQLPGATLQTSPHFLLPITDAVRAQLHVLPPVPGDDVRRPFSELFLDEIDLLVTDHNAPPLGAQPGPGLQVQQWFLSAVLSICDLYGWPLEQVWRKATAAPAAHFGVSLGESFVIVDPTFEQAVGLWPTRQTPERAPYLGMTLRGRVLGVGNEQAVELL